MQNQNVNIEAVSDLELCRIQRELFQQFNQVQMNMQIVENERLKREARVKIETSPEQSKTE